MNSSKRKREDNGVAYTSKTDKISLNSNYSYPLQTVMDDKEENEIVDDLPSKETKMNAPPITLVKYDTEQGHEMCNLSIWSYSIRKITIGCKLFCEIKYDKHNKVVYFSYTPKKLRPYKVVPYGLDKSDPIQLQFILLIVGLPCTDVKLVYRKTENK